MIVKNSNPDVQELAERSLHTITQILLSLPGGRRRDASRLKEMEFLTLSILQQNQPMIVGDIQRILGVLPAQMSRIIRSLEDREGRERPLIQCEINPKDKRKINVRMTNAGKKALADHLAPRVEMLQSLLGKLSDEERDELGSLLGRVEEILSYDDLDPEE